MDLLCNLINGLIHQKKKVDTLRLPSQGYFYKNNFEIFIKRAGLKDIEDYEKNFSKKDLESVINKVKNIVKNNIILKNDFTFEDIKSIDVVFLFIEIVKFTKKDKILISYIDENTNEPKIIEFSKKYFNYYKIPYETLSKYDYKKKQFEIDGYRFSIPSIGVENCLTYYLISKSKSDDKFDIGKISFDFTYFLGDKKHLTYDEIENLVYIFNEDLEESEKKKIRNIIKLFQPLQKYSLIKEGKEIDINSKIDLENIWK